MKKKLSQPPMIIFMEIVTLFLFIFMIQQSPAISFIFPEGRIFLGGQLVYQDIHTKKYKYLKNNKWVQLDKDFGGKFFIEAPCINEYCKNTPTTQGNDIKIAITGRLFENLAQLNFIACNTNASECGTLKYTITKESIVNEKALLEDNPILANIDGIENYLR